MLTEEEIMNHLRALEQRVVHLEQSVHPEQIAHDVMHKIAVHLHSATGATDGAHTSPPSIVHDHKPQ